MNASKENKYEQYVIKENEWNLTPDGPTQLSGFVILDHSIEAMKMLYGRTDDDQSSVLYLPRNWAEENMDLVKSFLQVEKLHAPHKLEIGMTENIIPAAEEGEEQEAFEVVEK